MTKINVEIPQDDYRKLKIITAATSVSMKDFVISAIRDKIQEEFAQPLIQEILN